MLQFAPSGARGRLLGRALFLVVLCLGAAYVGLSLVRAVEGAALDEALPYALLVVALLIALGFEFVNGFHDTANAVATVIYTHSLPPTVAVVWSGLWNFIGVMAASGAVAYAVVALLPVELILQVGSSTGFAMVFALLVAAILWNLGTWWLGLPNSSSHTLIGSIIGVGLMNELLADARGTSGVDWSQAGAVGKSLLISPVVGFIGAGLLLLTARALLRNPALFKAPEEQKPPPPWIRGLLILTSTGVSFAHGSNDGQKGMGLIMLVLIGTVPAAFALNRAVTEDQTLAFSRQAEAAAAAIERQDRAAAGGDMRAAVLAYLERRIVEPGATLPALAKLVRSVGTQVAGYGSLAAVPGNQVGNVRNDMYLSGEAIRLLLAEDAPRFDTAERDALLAYVGAVDQATRFIPTWVKVAVALALGLGTMVGWRRIVITVGEKIGKRHLTYAQGASAELTAALTIGGADLIGLPVSTTHVLSSGVAGTMAANGSGLQWATVRSLATAWILTLPASVLLAGGLYWLFLQLA